jgi:hypothetical protein
MQFFNCPLTFFILWELCQLRLQITFTSLCCGYLCDASIYFMKASHVQVTAVNDLLARVECDAPQPQHAPSGLLMLNDAQSHSPTTSSPSPSQAVTLESSMSIFRRIRAVCDAKDDGGGGGDSDAESVVDIVRSQSSYGLEPVDRVAAGRAVRRLFSFDEALNEMIPCSKRNKVTADHTTVVETKTLHVRGGPGARARPSSSSVRRESQTSAIDEARALLAAMDSEPCPAGVGAQSRVANKNGAACKKKVATNASKKKKGAASA